MNGDDLPTITDTLRAFYGGVVWSIGECEGQALKDFQAAALHQLGTLLYPHVADSPHITAEAAERAYMGLSHVADPLRDLQALIDYAYATGFHELGYNPLVAFCRAAGYATDASLLPVVGELQAMLSEAERR